MEKFGFDSKKLSLANCETHSSVARIFLHQDSALWLVLAARGENAAVFVKSTLGSLEKIPWYTPDTLDIFLQNSLKLAQRKEYQLSFALVLCNSEKNYFYTAGGAIVLLRDRKSGRLLASDDYHILRGELLDNDQLILASDNSPRLVADLRQWLLESTTPPDLLVEKRDSLTNETLSLLHFFPSTTPDTTTTDKIPDDEINPTRFSLHQLLARARRFLKTSHRFVKQQQTWFAAGLILLICAGLAAVLANYHHVGQALQEANQNQPALAPNTNDALALDDETTTHFGNNPGDATLFYDLTLALPNFAPQKMIRLGSDSTKLAFLDTTSKQALVLDLLNKSQQSLDLSALPTIPNDLTFFEGQLVFLTNPLQAFDLNTTQWQSISPTLDYLGTANSLASFGRNLYVIDGTQIYRLEYDRAGKYQKEGTWLNDDVNLPASQATDFTIDRSIYISTYAGDFNKYEQGRRLNNFATDLHLTGPVYSYADGDNENLYVLQRETGQIFVTDHDGSQTATLSSDTFSQSTGLVAIESLNRLYVLVGHLIYFANLNFE